MKGYLPFCFLILFSLVGCHRKPTVYHTLSAIETTFQKGQFTRTVRWADSLMKSGNADSLTIVKLKLLVDNIIRIRADFSLTDAETDSLLLKAVGSYTPSERELWERNNWLEYRTIDGAKHYFKRTIPNLILILKSRQPVQAEDQNLDAQAAFCLAQSRKVIALSKSDGKPVQPVKLKVSYQLIVKPDAVPDGETVRCWLPWPHENCDRQVRVRLLKTIPSLYFIAPDSVGQRTVYLTRQAVKGKPVTFGLEFEYLSMAQYFDLDKIRILRYDTTSVIFKRYTAMQYPQIFFTDQIKHLSDSIVGRTSNPVEKVRKIYYWINDHIIWTSALEYSIIPFIPGYVLDNRRGDCGMQTLLFMAMARYQHIPVKWQSGWMMHPGAVNLHDWCEVYYAGTGWVPLDMSFNLQRSKDRHEQAYYISGIDAYRLIINDGIGCQLVPGKKFARSEPYDFQRGEVEWSGGNLYFNQWDYHMKVAY